MKKIALVVALVLGAALVSALPSAAQFQRYDYIWARSTGGAALTLDGHLSEPQWAQAESLVLNGRTSGPIPGSGWKDEGGVFASADPAHAVFRFLVVGNQLWIGVTARDSSIGGSAAFNTLDGLLMSIKQHQLPNRPAIAGEHFISWWWPIESLDPAPEAINKPMSMIGIFRTWPPGGVETPANLAAWEAAWSVDGVVNSDTLPDKSYTVEMRFDLGATGYDVTRPSGDVVEWNASVYDNDWTWPLTNYFHYYSNRTWIEGPWGNAAHYSNFHIMGRPDVTVNSVSLPAAGPDLSIPNGIVWPNPTIDGRLNEAVWARADSIRITYGDAALRASYPGTGPFRSGEYQPSVNAGLAFVQDPGDATVKYFYKGTTLYIGVDARDQAVQYRPDVDRWDGGILSINDRVKRSTDNTLLSYRMAFEVGPTGQLVASDSLPNMITLGQVQAALAIKPGTTVDTLGGDFDTGWQAEFAIDLTKLGYPADLGDRAVYWGFDLLDGDSWPVFTDSYSTRTWFFRQYENEDGPCVAFLNPTKIVTTGVDAGGVTAPTSLQLLGAFPNPFKSSTTLRFRLPRASSLRLDIFDLQGRLMGTRALGVQPAGDASVRVPAISSTSGVYLYRVHVADAVTGASQGTLSGKMMILE
jgi:hypothetical protein